MDSAKNVRWIIPCKEFGMVKVKNLTKRVNKNMKDDAFKECCCFSISGIIMLELKVISLCNQCRARPACTSVQSDQALY